MKPFLKWAGGKRWLFSDEFLSDLPQFTRYIEPFLGGGAGFFAISPKMAILSDINPELINLYECIRSDPAAISSGLECFQKKHSKSHYYAVRAKGYSPGVDGAIRTLYLNRTCWNGLFRLNLRGEFNVPMGTKTAIYDPEEQFDEISELLGKADLTCRDFETTIDLAKQGDLVFVDPPYTVKHNVNGFIKYNESIFSWDDQVRLASAVRRAIARGARIVLTNADHESVRALYSDFQNIRSVTRSSVISGKASGRSKTTEMLLVA